MDIFVRLVEQIIKEQEGIIGPIALEQAKKVPGLQVDWQKHEVKLEGDEKEVVEKLVEQYKKLFGQASVEACKEAVRDTLAKLSPDQVPSLLR